MSNLNKESPGFIENSNTSKQNLMDEVPQKSILMTSERRLMLGVVIAAGLGEMAYNIVNMSAMPVYTKYIHLSLSWTAIFLFAFLIMESPLKAPMGLLSDRIGRKPLILLAPCVSMCTSLLITITHAPYLILILRILDGVAAAALWPATFCLIADHIPEIRHSAAMSWFNTAYLVGIAFSPAIGGHLDDHFHTPIVSFYAASILFGLTLIASIILIPGGRPIHTGQAEAVDFNTMKRIVKAIPLLMLLIFLIFFGIGLVMSYLKPFVMHRYHLSEGEFGNALLIPALLVASLSTVLGSLGDKYGKPMAVKLGLAFCAFSFWALFTSTAPWTLEVLGTFIGVGFVVAFPSFMAIVSCRCDPEVRGGSVGAVGAAQGLGAILGVASSSVLWGVKIPEFLHIAKHEIPFIGCAVFITLAYILSMIPTVLEGKTRATE